MVRLFAICFCIAGLTRAAAGEWTTYVYGSHAAIGSSETTLVPESSGVVASRYNPDIFWTHNDSGAVYARVYAFRLSAADKLAGVGKHMGYVELPGAGNVDWEDISAGPGRWLYVFDGGDNPSCQRTDKRIHRFVEPTIDPAGSPIAQAAVFDSIRFEYPDASDPALPADSNTERYDAECMMVHPATADVYVVTKRDTNNAYLARVYKLPASSIAWNSPQVHVLRFVADISARVPNMTTGGDIHADGHRLIVRNYLAAYEFILPVGQPFDAVFQQTPSSYPLLAEWSSQGEGIGYATFDGDIVTTTEAPSDGKYRINAIAWRLANLRATDLTDTSAVIRWDTASAGDSRVDFGLTTGYGQVVSDSAQVASHALALDGLVAGNRYYFRAATGSLQYPDAARAPDFSFVARYVFPADFDDDGDVDLADFSYLQSCLSGPNTLPEDLLCLDADLDGDDDVDPADLSRMRACMSGAAIRPDPACR